jgi:hypothetical protein
VLRGQGIDGPVRAKTVLHLEPLDCRLGPRAEEAIYRSGSIAEPAQTPLYAPNPL